MEKKKKGKKTESILFNLKIEKHLGAGYINMFTKTCNHKDKLDNAINFNKIVGNIGKELQVRHLIIMKNVNKCKCI